MYEVIYTPHPNLYIEATLDKQLHTYSYSSNMLILEEEHMCRYWAHKYHAYYKGHLKHSGFERDPRLNILSLDRTAGRIIGARVNGIMLVMCDIDIRTSDAGRAFLDRTCAGRLMPGAYMEVVHDGKELAYV